MTFVTFWDLQKARLWILVQDLRQAKVKVWRFWCVVGFETRVALGSETGGAGT